jgi:hypothetical protein
MISQKMICIKSQIVVFPIMCNYYTTIVGNEYNITTSGISNNGKYYYFIDNQYKRTNDMTYDMTLCDIDNFITIAEYREQQIKTVLDE